MNFSINKQTLFSVLAEHNKVVPIRTTLPVLSCSCFEIKENELSIKTTNLDQTIISKTTIKDEEEGSVAIPMNKKLIYKIGNGLATFMHTKLIEIVLQTKRNKRGN